MRTLMIFSVMTVLAFVSCKKDSDNDPAICSSAWATTVLDELSALSTASTNYTNNPTHETCIAYKNAFQDYIDALEPFLECSAYSAQDKAEVQAQIDEAEEDLATLCDE